MRVHCAIGGGDHVQLGLAAFAAPLHRLANRSLNHMLNVALEVVATSFYSMEKWRCSVRNYCTTGELIKSR